jgi:hypothetical protein
LQHVHMHLWKQRESKSKNSINNMYIWVYIKDVAI